MQDDGAWQGALLLAEQADRDGIVLENYSVNVLCCVSDNPLRSSVCSNGVIIGGAQECVGNIGNKPAPQRNYLHFFLFPLKSDLLTFGRTPLVIITHKKRVTHPPPPQTKQLKTLPV